MHKFFMFFCLLLISCVSFLLIGADKALDDEPKAYILMEAETKTVLEEHNSDLRLNAGYLTKLMSLLLIAEKINNGELSVTDMLTASESVKNTKGAVIWLESGDKLSVDELLKSVIIGNANDALTVLAEAASGDIGTFVMDMNAKAFDLGLRNTFYFSPYGYFEENEYTTAHDIAVVCSELAKYDFLTPAFSTWRDFVKEGKVELVSENKLTKNYGLHIGFKACHSDESGYCTAECGRNDSGNTFIAVAVGAENEDISYKTVKSLLKNGFRQYKVTSTMFPEEMLKPLTVIGGTEKAVETGLATQGKVTVSKEKRDLKTKVVYPEFINAPVYIGQPIGCAAFYSGDTLVYETDIIVKKDIPSLSFGYVFKSMLLKLIE